MKRIIGLLGVLGMSPWVWADDDAWYGTWVERSPGRMTMTVEASSGGTKFTYQLPPNFVMSFETRLDGKEVPVLTNGKPSGELMVAKRIDARHLTGAFKINGAPAGASTSELSADGKVIKVVGDSPMPGPDGKIQKVTQYWDKK